MKTYQVSRRLRFINSPCRLVTVGITKDVDGSDWVRSAIALSEEPECQAGYSDYVECYEQVGEYCWRRFASGVGGRIRGYDRDDRTLTKRNF